MMNNFLLPSTSRETSTSISSGVHACIRTFSMILATALQSSPRCLFASMTDRVLVKSQKNVSVIHDLCDESDKDGIKSMQFLQALPGTLSAACSLWSQSASDISEIVLDHSSIRMLSLFRHPHPRWAFLCTHSEFRGGFKLRLKIQEEHLGKIILAWIKAFR